MLETCQYFFKLNSFEIFHLHTMHRFLLVLLLLTITTTVWADCSTECGEVVALCTGICVCDLPACECCAECAGCIGHLWEECCDCFDICSPEVKQNMTKFLQIIKAMLQNNNTHEYFKKIMSQNSYGTAGYDSTPNKNVETPMKQNNYRTTGYGTVPKKNVETILPKHNTKVVGCAATECAYSTGCYATGTVQNMNNYDYVCCYNSALGYSSWNQCHPPYGYTGYTGFPHPGSCHCY